jgi:CheY-like chemotaxis protein
VVEDHADLREMLALLLEAEGYEVETANNGAEALDALEHTRPAVILLDLMMPVMNGWEFWDRRQIDTRLRNIPVIVVTATGMTTGSIGDARVVSKPIDRAHLRATVAEVVALSTNAQANVNANVNDNANVNANVNVNV